MAILALLALTLTACADGKNAKGSVFFHSYDNEYLNTVKSEMEKSLKDSGLEYSIHDGAGLDNTLLVEIDSAIAGKTKLLTVNLPNTDSDELAKKVIEKAKKANIPLVLFGGAVSDATLSSYDKCVYVGNDFEMAGKLQGRLMGNYLVDNYDAIDRNGDGKIQYIMVRDMAGGNESQAGMLYSISECNKILEENGFPALVFYDGKSSSPYISFDGKESSAASTMKALFSGFNERNGNMIELAVGESDGIALGIISALEDIGFNRSKDKKIPVFGIGASKDAVSRIDDGMMTGTVKIEGRVMADTLIKISENILGGKSAFEGIDKDWARGSNRIYVPCEAYPDDTKT